MNRKKSDSRATLALYIFAALILLFLVDELGRGFYLGNKALMDVKNDIVNAVSGGR